MVTDEMQYNQILNIELTEWNSLKLTRNKQRKWPKINLKIDQKNGQMWTNKLTENLPTNVNFEQLKIQFEISNRISNS